MFTGLVLLVTRRPSRRRRLKILVAAVAGGVCGTLWVLFVATILDAARPGTLMDLPLVALGVVVALSVAVLLSGSGRSREVAGRSLMTTGFNSLALPIAALISFLVGGAQLPAGSAGTELSAVILGVRLAGSVATVGLSVGGLLAGAFLVFLGDRLLRQARQARRGRADAAANVQ
jgi:zinc transporter ZupT